MKNERVLVLSRNFWDNYKLFLKGELTRKELGKYIENLDDIIFYKKNCNHHFYDWDCLRKVYENSLDTIADTILSTLREAPPSRQKGILKDFLRIPFEMAFGNVLKKKWSLRFFRKIYHSE